MDNEVCAYCNKPLKAICEMKHIDGVCYCIDCYREKFFPQRMKELRDAQNKKIEDMKKFRDARHE